MYSNKCETEIIKDEIARCEDVDELIERIFPMLESQEKQWSHKMCEIIKTSGLRQGEFAKRCGMSRVTVNNWCNGVIPKNRERFLRIGMAAGYGKEEMNQLLVRYGRYPKLYPKSLEDCVCIFVLGKEYGEETLKKYNYILNKIKENIIKDDTDGITNVDTEKFNEKLSDIKDEDELEKFISDNIATFSTTYHRFYTNVKMYIKTNYQKYGETFSELAAAQGWSSSLKQCVSEINQHKWYPTRNKIISLGLHLSMDHEMIDYMLEAAQMEPLCAKNIFESVIMFILDDASLNNILNTESEEFDPDELCRYARKVLNKIDLPQVKSFITELSEMNDDV